jgi:hypothetical protein
MTTTDSPTAAGRAARSTEPSAPSARPLRKAPTDQDDVFRLPRAVAVESIEQYFRLMNLVLDVNRHLVMCWTGRAGLLSAAARERLESGGRSMPGTGPRLDGDDTTQDAETVQQVARGQVARGRVARATPPDRDQQPDTGVRTTERGPRPTTRRRPATAPTTRRSDASSTSTSPDH